MGLSVEFRRHAPKDGANRHLIGPIGHREARLVGEHQLRGMQFSELYVSRLWRTTQTLVSFAEGAKDMIPPGNFNPQIPPFNAAAETDQAMRLWGVVCREAEVAGEDLVAGCLARDPLTCALIGRQAATGFRAWFQNQPDGSRLLIVGHSPFIEFLAMDIFGGIILPGLRYCDGFRIIFQDNRYILETARDNPRLNAAGLREDLK